MFEKLSASPLSVDISPSRAGRTRKVQCFWFLVALIFVMGGTHTMVHAQSGLPPEIQRDILVKQITKSIKEENHSETLSLIDKLAKLQKKLPASIMYFRGRAEFEVGEFHAAEQSISGYLKQEGKKAKFYDQSLELLTKIYENGDKLAEQKSLSEQAQKVSSIVDTDLDFLPSGTKAVDFDDVSIRIMSREGKNRKYGLVDFSGNTLVPLGDDFISRFHNGVATIYSKSSSKFGLISHTGRIILEPSLDEIERVSKHKVRCARLGRKNGLINNQGEWVFSLRTEADKPVWDGCVNRQKKSPIYLFKSTTKKLLKNITRDAIDYYYVNESGKVVLGPIQSWKYFDVGGFQHANAILSDPAYSGHFAITVTRLSYIEGRGSNRSRIPAKDYTVILDKNGDVVSSEYPVKFLNGNLVPGQVVKKKLYSYRIADGEHYFSSASGKTFLINRKTGRRLNVDDCNQYNMESYISNDLFPCKDANGLYGLKRMSGTWAAQPQFETLYVNGKFGAVAKKQGADKVGLIDQNGNWLWKPVFDSIGYINEQGRAIVEINGQQKIVSFK